MSRLARPRRRGLLGRLGRLGEVFPPHVAKQALLGGPSGPSLSEQISDLTTGWTVEDTAVSSSPSWTVDGGGVGNLTVAAGGVGGSFWFDANDGVLVYKTVTGLWSMRAHVTIRNSADTGDPPVTSFRIAGIAVHDPDRTDLNYLHIGAGSAGSGPDVEVKTTDDTGTGTDTSAFASAALTGLDLDLRIDRTSADVFDLYYRQTHADLSSDSGWTAGPAGGTVDRSDNTIPDRDVLGASVNAAVALPDEVRIGFTVYSNVAGHDIQLFVNDFLWTPS